MRFTSSIVRKLMKGGSLVLLSLLVPTLATAASTAPHRGGARVCDPSTVPLRKLARLPKTIGGPLAGPSTRAAAGLSDAVAKVHRGSRTALADDDEAIQTDAPAAWHDADEDLAPGLEPVGSLARACVHKPTTHDFSPRSPRGPPLAG